MDIQWHSLEEISKSSGIDIEQLSKIINKCHKLFPTIPKNADDKVYPMPNTGDLLTIISANNFYGLDEKTIITRIKKINPGLIEIQKEIKSEVESLLLWEQEDFNILKMHGFNLPFKIGIFKGAFESLSSFYTQF